MSKMKRRFVCTILIIVFVFTGCAPMTYPKDSLSWMVILNGEWFVALEKKFINEHFSEEQIPSPELCKWRHITELRNFVDTHLWLPCEVTIAPMNEAEPYYELAKKLISNSHGQYFIGYVHYWDLPENRPKDQPLDKWLDGLDKQQPILCYVGTKDQ